tara:strand:- start:904 stop:1191 length:288 start_codon:yes stop_codon:yes gene_type:complete
MSIEYFSIAILILSLALSITNIYLVLAVKKYIKSDEIKQRFHLMKQEISVLHQKQGLHQTQTAQDAIRLSTLEKVMSALITSGGSRGPEDDGWLN